MTTRYADVPQREHELVLDSLPWYSEGTLNPVESARAEQHLETCAECRAALEQYQFLGTGFAARGETAPWQPSEAHFERLLAMVDLAEYENASAAPARKARKWNIGLASLRNFFATTPTAWRWFMGVETLALAALLLLVVLPRWPAMPWQGQAFETLTRADQPVAEGPRVHVVFAEEATEADIRRLLQAIHGQLVEGPSSIGVYTVRLDTAGAAAETLGQALKILRANAKVRLAEPVSGQAAP